MPPKRVGPSTRQEADKRAAQAQLKDARLQHAVKVAVREGAQPTTFNRIQVRALHVAGRRVKLQHADGTLTEAGKHYHQHVGQYPPLRYSYEQPLINYKFVMGYNGNRVKVRTWKNGEWQVTKQGEAYFKYNKNEYVVNRPVRRAVERQDVWVWAQGDNQHNTLPVAEMKHVKPGNRGDPVSPAPDAPLVLPRSTAHLRLAYEAARMAYLREGVMHKIKQNAQINIEGRPYYTMAPYSATRLVWDDATREWTVSAQRTSFHEEGRPTIETILNRPLNGATMIPLGTPYPWGVDKQSSEGTGYCLIDMVYNMAMRRARDKWGARLQALLS